MYRVNNKLCSVHPSLRAIRLCFPVDAVDNLCQKGTRKLDTSPRQFGLEIVDTSDLQHGYIADVGVTQVRLKQGILLHLPCTLGVVNGDLWKTFRVCPIVPGWTHVVPEFTTPAVFTTVEPYFLQGVWWPPPLHLPHIPRFLPGPSLASSGVGRVVEGTSLPGVEGWWTKRKPHSGTPL